MKCKFISFLFLLLGINTAVTAAQDCPSLVEKALSRVERACAGMRTSQACYGYQMLEASLQQGLSPFAFNGVGDITGVETIRSLRLSAFDPMNEEWGVSVMRVRADIANEYPNENVTLLAFGDVSIDPAQSDEFGPMQAFAFRTGDASSGCTDITENGLLIQTPEGIGRITLWINDVRVRIGSTVLFEALPGGDLTISTFEGLAQVEALGVMQEAPAGMRVRVPMNENMLPAAPPTLPEAFDARATGLMPFVEVVTAFTDGTVSHLVSPHESNAINSAPESETFSNLPLPPSANNPSPVTLNQPPPISPTQPPDDSGNDDGDEVSDSDAEGCNQDHGSGNGNGNCYGHDNGEGD